MSRVASLLATLSLVLALAACGGGGADVSAEPEPTGRAGGLTDLRSVDELRSLFNRHTGEPRLVVLASPT